jgi:hypothetical protein
MVSNLTAPSLYLIIFKCQSKDGVIPSVRALVLSFISRSVCGVEVRSVMVGSPPCPIDFSKKRSIIAPVECEAYPYDDVDRGVPSSFFPRPQRRGFLLPIFSPSCVCPFSFVCYNESAVAGEHSLNNKKGGLPPPPLSFVHHVR